MVLEQWAALYAGWARADSGRIAARMVGHHIARYLLPPSGLVVRTLSPVDQIIVEGGTAKGGRATIER